MEQLRLAQSATSVATLPTSGSVLLEPIAFPPATTAFLGTASFAPDGVRVLYAGRPVGGTRTELRVLRVDAERTSSCGGS